MRIIIYILLIFSLSCTEERIVKTSFLLGQINTITIDSDKTDYIIEDNIIQPNLTIKYSNLNGEVIVLGSIKPSFLINGQIESVLKIPLNKKDDFQVSVVLGDIESNKLSFRVISLAEATASIKLIGEPNSFFINDKAIDLEEYYSVEITDIFGTIHSLDLSDPRLTIYSDQQIIGNVKDAIIETGNRKLTATIGGNTSNIIQIFINDPFSSVGKIELSLDTLSNSPFGIANFSTFSFEYKIFDRDDKEISLENISLFTNGIKVDGFDNIILGDAGMQEFYAESFGVRSNRIKITSREDINFTVRVIPLIFHIYHNGEPIGQGNNISSQTISDEIIRVNEAFENTFRTELLKDNNAVNTYFQYVLASEDETGSILTEKGIHRNQTSTSIFGTSSAETTDLLFNTMWNPKMYMNIHVLKLDDVFSYAYYPLLKNNLPGVSVDGSDNPDLTFPYGVVFNNVHFNSYNQVLAHELGHTLSLAHTFNNDNCTTDDNVSDTPNYINTSDFVNNLFRIDCDNSVFLSTNYMDYNGGNFNSFTYSQRERMQFVWEFAHFFPGALGSPVSGGRIEYQSTNWKGEIDYSIKPVMCKIH